MEAFSAVEDALTVMDSRVSSPDDWKNKGQEIL